MNPETNLALTCEISAEANIERQPYYRALAAAVMDDNEWPGSPGYCAPSKALWTIEMLRPGQLRNIFRNSSKAAAWLQAEIRMDIADEMHRGWAAMLAEPICEDVTIFIRDGRAYIWDGWHRTAASLATHRPLRALVGRPISDH